MPVSFLESMRAFVSVPAPFRSEPVLVLPGEVDPRRVEAYVREWCPDAARRGDTVLAIPEGFDVLGPFHRQEGAKWPDHGLPATFRTAYVTRPRPADDGGDDWAAETRHLLLYGLARRLSGQVRDRCTKPWRDPAEFPAAPNVQAPKSGRLAHEALIRLLASHYPGFVAKPEESFLYDLQGAGGVGDSVWLATDLTSPTAFPLTRLRFSVTGPTEIVQYEFEHDTTAVADLRRMAEVAAAIAAATGGIILDEDGFPWP